MTTTARIHPRVRARRVAVVRARGRRRLRVLIAATAGIAVVAGAWLLTTSPLFDVDRVVVRGADAVPDDVVRAAAGVGAGDALVLLDLDAVERRVEAVPAVRDARAERDLPGGLRVTVVEREPAAWARRGDGTVAVLDPTGRVIAAGPAEAPPALPEITGLGRVPGAGHTGDDAATATKTLAELPAELRARVATVVLFGGVVMLDLADGVEVRLGRPRNVAAKGQRALAVLAAEAGAPVAYVDVRVPAVPVTG